MNLLERYLNNLQAIFESHDDEYFAAVAIVQDGQRWLLGLSTADDDRSNTWTAPGGHIKRGESPEDAAVRECFEETGIRCKAVGEAFSLTMKPGIAFVHCKVTRSGQKFKANNEFAVCGFFKKSEFKGLKLYKSVNPSISKL